MKKLLIITLTIFIFGIIGAGIVVTSIFLINNLVNSVTVPANFDYAFEAESEIMASAMRNFVLEETKDYTEDGTLSISENIAENSSIFIVKSLKFSFFNIDFSVFFGYNIPRNAQRPEHPK